MKLDLLLIGLFKPERSNIRPGLILLPGGETEITSDRIGIFIAASTSDVSRHVSSYSCLIDCLCTQFYGVWFHRSLIQMALVCMNFGRYDMNGCANLTVHRNRSFGVLCLNAAWEKKTLTRFFAINLPFLAILQSKVLLRLLPPRHQEFHSNFSLQMYPRLQYAHFIVPANA